MTACPAVEAFGALVSVRPGEHRGRLDLATRVQQTSDVPRTGIQPVERGAADASPPLGLMTTSQAPTAITRNGHGNSPARRMETSRVPSAGVVIAPPVNPLKIA